MALRKDIPTAPGTRPDPKHATTYQASKGGHYKPAQPAPKPSSKQR
jgi:hypothetical protein